MPSLRSVRHCGLLLIMALLALPGCAGKHREIAPESLTASVPAAPETEVKPAPEAEPPAAAPPPVAPQPAVPNAGVSRPASPDELTKETLEAKPARTSALTPPGANVAAKASMASPEQPAARAVAPARAIAVVGDSLAVGIGMTMEQNLKSYAGVGCYPLGKVSTGLISKKFFDWEGRLAELVATEKLAAVVVMMGGNDANNPIAGHAAGTPEWDAAYRAKAESFLRIAAKAGIKVLWVGLPAMRDPAYAARVRAVNVAARAACGAVAGCIYMEASDTFVDASGNYVQAKDIGGKTVPLRAKDGVHMTMSGYDLLCRQVLDRLSKLGDLPH